VADINKVPSTNRPHSDQEDQPAVAPSVEIGGDVRDANVIVGDGNQVNTTINRVRNVTTNIIKSARPRDYIIYTSIFLLLLSAIGYLFWYNNLRYDRAIASGRLNVLVVPFVEKHAWGYGKSDIGWSLAQIFTDGVKKSFGESGIDADVKILGPSDRVPTIFGFNENQLTHSAETVSEKIGGQVVIYGVISQDEYGDSVVQVKFYISPTNFGEAQDLISDSVVGDLSLGSFVLTGSTVSGADLLAQNKELRDRLEIFSSIINFLGAYIGEDFTRAQDYIAKAGDPGLWNNTSGLEVVDLLKGNLELRRARTFLVQKDLPEGQKSIDLARTYFNNALDTSLKNAKGHYARAYLGLAGVESLAAVAKTQVTGDVSAIDTAALEKVLELLSTAEQADYTPETADVTVKVNYSKAQVNLAYFAKTGDAGYLNEAQKYYQLVVAEFEKTGNQRIADFATLSHTGLGHIAAQRNQVDEAVKNFQAAYKLTSNPSLKVQCLVNIGDIYFTHKDYARALDSYRSALARKNDLEKAISQEKITEIQQRIDSIQAGGQL